MTHRLRQAYMDAIREKYDIGLWGDKYPEKTELLALRVDRLGVSYEMFAHLAVVLWADWAKKKGHSYPYWNIVMSEKSFERIGAYLSLLEGLDVPDVNPDALHDELAYATAYIEWMSGQRDRRPLSTGASVEVKILVAEYLCRLHGLVLQSSNYNHIAEQLDGRRSAHTRF